MALTISSVALEEKNKLSSDGVWYLALKITIPGLVDPIRLIRNNENIEWPTGSGINWIAFPFELDEIGEESKGEVPQVELKVSNISRVMEQYLQDYDAYIKRYGFSPVEVNIYVINSKNLASATPEVEYLFELKQPKTNYRWATFVLGASNPFNKRFPQNRMLKNHCRFKFNTPTGLTLSGNPYVATTIAMTVPGNGILVDSTNGFLVAGFTSGQWVFISGFSNPYNNLWFKILTIDASNMELGQPGGVDSLRPVSAVAESAGPTISVQGYSGSLSNETVNQLCYYQGGTNEYPYMTCNKTLSDCRLRNNSSRFGGFPGVGLGGIRLGI